MYEKAHYCLRCRAGARTRTDKVGHVLGGQFYSVYYNGALHPFSDAAQNFSDKFVNISDHIVTADEDDDSDFDTDWVQDYLETRRNAIEHGDMLSSRSIKSITST